MITLRAKSAGGNFLPPSGKVRHRGGFHCMHFLFSPSRTNFARGREASSPLCRSKNKPHWTCTMPVERLVCRIFCSHCEDWPLVIGFGNNAITIERQRRVFSAFSFKYLQKFTSLWQWWWDCDCGVSGNKCVRPVAKPKLQHQHRKLGQWWYIYQNDDGDGHENWWGWWCWVY